MKEKRKETRIQWHPGFVAAMNLEFVEQRSEMIMEREHIWLRALSKEMEREDFERLSEAAGKLDETANGEFIDSVLQVSIRANEKKLKEDKDMCCEALRELFEPELKESWKKGQKQGQRQSVRAMVNTMTQKGYRSDEIIDIIMQSFQLDRNEAMKYFVKS